MLKTWLFTILFFSFQLVHGQLDTIAPPFDCTGKDTLETWQGIKYIKLVSNESGITPKKGDKIYVNYTGFLDSGIEFDSNWGQRPFVFRFQKMEVIRGWDIVFEYIRTGEKVRIIVPWKYAYGKYGEPGQIPPKANLTFDVEVKGIQQLSD